jgi:hypothetical protein
LLGATAYLGPLVVPDPAAVAGPWCSEMPLWGNPALTAPDGSCLEAQFPALSSLRGLTTLGTAVRCWDALAPVRAILAEARRDGAEPSPRLERQCTRLLRAAMLRGVLGLRELGPAAGLLGSQAADGLTALLTVVPPCWVEAAREVLVGAAAAPSERDAWAALLRALVWRSGCGICVPVLGLTVKLGTHLQLAGALADLAARHTAFLADALGVAAAPPDALPRLRDTLRRLWKLRWENEHKEPLWRLALHGITGFPMAADRVARAARAGHVHVLRCPCGAGMSGEGGCWVRRHLFWDCHLARSLREAMGAAMGAAVGSLDAAFTREHLWLVLPPPGIQQRVWDVVALAAVAALERGRQRMYKGWSDGAPLTHQQLVVLGTDVVADFWGRVASFASLGIPPKGWGAVPSQHPFLARHDRRVVFCGPPDTASPPASP